MSNVAPHGFGWQRDLPDHRDFTPDHDLVQEMLRPLAPLRDSGRASHDRVDLREYCPPVPDQQELATSTAHACVALVQYFERRATGRLIQPSRLFVHAAARRLSKRSGDGPLPLRAALKAMARFGLPPERYWPYDPQNVDRAPDPFAYGFRERGAALVYLRLDGRGQSGRQTLDQVRSFLAAGFACVLGFPVCDAQAGEADVAFPTLHDSVHEGQAVAVLGYDDKLRIRSDKGALLIRSSWGAEWGDAGYGWLPYAYLKEQLAADCWTLIQPDWLRSGEFYRPA